MKKRICGIIAQHFWELSPPANQTNEESLRTRALPEQLEAFTKSGEIDRFVISMERGLPLELVPMLLELREHLDIKLECVIPYEEQHVSWPEQERECYFSLLSRCDKEHMIQHPFTLDCYQKSIKYLFSCCDCFLILWNGRASDAGDAVKMARRKHLPFFVLDPSHLSSV